MNTCQTCSCHMAEYLMEVVHMGSTERYFVSIAFIPSVLDLNQYVFSRDYMSMIRS